MISNLLVKGKRPEFVNGRRSTVLLMEGDLKYFLQIEDDLYYFYIEVYTSILSDMISLNHRLNELAGQPCLT